MKKFHLLFILLFTAVYFTGCKPMHYDDDVLIAFYNCENFFDTTDNPNKNDDEFTPSGTYHYTQRSYEQKLHNIATVFQSMGSYKTMPALIGLAEVENDAVLATLSRQPELERNNYHYVLTDGHDVRGINVGLLYNPERFRMLSHESIAIKDKDTSMLTRDILHVFGILNTDTVDIFVNHWPSRRNENEIGYSNNRIIVAKILKEQIDALVRTHPPAKIIVMGDFNDNPTDSSINIVLCAKEHKASVYPTDLYNPYVNLYKNGSGTEAYQHNWNLFDQILLSGSLVNTTGKGLRYKEAIIYKPDFMTEHRKDIEGTPRRSYTGTRWHNGYSDHFPVMIILSSN